LSPVRGFQILAAMPELVTRSSPSGLNSMR
jgi:hypothetical protein